jgi:hypothetical protein
MQIISCSIDVTKIDKSKLIQGKNGAQYFNFDVVVKDAPDQYGKDAAVQLSKTKEERQAKAQTVYIGNGKVVFRSDNTPSQKQPESNDTSNKLPF